MIALIALAAMAADAPAAPGLAGLYESNQIEVAAALELKPDGRFRYQLDYGAVSEAAEGRWRSKDDSITLTSDPMPREPHFGVAAFRGEPVRVVESDLVMFRYGTRIRFERVRP